MSEVTSKITKPLLGNLERTAQEKTRKAVQGQVGQLLILRDIKVFKEIISSSLGIDLTVSTEQKALRAAVQVAKRLQSKFKARDKNRFKAIERRLHIAIPKGGHALGVDIFIVHSFHSSILAVKEAIFAVLTESGEITPDQASGVKGQIHRGHGVRGNAVSQIGIAKSVSKIGGIFGRQASQTLLLNNLEAFGQKASIGKQELRELRSLTINYDQIVTTRGKLKARYFSIIDFQQGAENIGVDSATKKALVKTFRDYIKFLGPQLAQIHRSSNLVEKVEKTLVDAVAGRPRKNKKVTRRKKGIASKTKGKSKAAQPRNAKGQFIKRAAPKAIKKAKGTAKGVSASPLALLVAINKELPNTLLGNMGTPRLNNRSSRFRNSVKATHIITPKRGFPTIEYAYQTYPYGTFEPGNAQGSKDRDPRALIDLSIRQIAVKLALTKFHTRRM